MVQHRAFFHDHEFPLWNRYDWCGLTLLGQSLSMIGDPLDWIAILTGGASWAWDWKFVIAQVLFAFCRGAHGAAHERQPFRGVAAHAFRTLHGLLCLSLQSPPPSSLCYSPWILLAWIEGVRAPTPAPLGCVGAAPHPRGLV